MNHQKIYNTIINKAKQENRIKQKGIYYEKHHIIPKCLEGNNEDENLVLLTAKEHFIAHKLLTYIYKGNRKIACAFYRMVYSNRGNYNKSSRNYSYARELISLTPMSDETKQKISLGLKGKKHKEISEEGRKNMSNAAKNKPPDTKETRFRKGISRRGKNHLPQTIEKMKNTKHNISETGRLNLGLANKGKTSKIN